MQYSNNLIVNLTFDFAVEIIQFTELLHERRKYNLSNQLFRSGTSIGANVNEAQSCESRADFIHKIKLAAKEAEETKYWMSLSDRVESYPAPSVLIFEKLQVIIKILNKIIATSKVGQGKP